MDAVISLSCKAIELRNKMHVERSQEKWHAALAAAESLGAPDCLVVASLQTHVASAAVMVEKALDRSDTGAALTAATTRACLARFRDSVNTLHRRRDAGTLLYGTCRAEEVRWHLEHMRASTGGQNARNAGAQVLKTVAPLVGYTAVLANCRVAGMVLAEALSCSTLEAGEVPELLTWFCNLYDECVTLMVLPRVLPNQPMGDETAVYRAMRSTRAVLARSPAYASWSARLEDSAARLERSGVPKQRSMCGEDADQWVGELKQKLERSSKKAASGEMLSCALGSCGAREAHPSHFSKCGACKAVAYCCREHQVADWPAHKAACKAARKAAAPKDAAQASA